MFLPFTTSLGIRRSFRVVCSSPASSSKTILRFSRLQQINQNNIVRFSTKAIKKKIPLRDRKSFKRFRFLFRFVRTGVLLGTFGWGMYSYGQIVLLDDYDKYRENTFRQLIGETKTFLSFNDNDNLNMLKISSNAPNGYVYDVNPPSEMLQAFNCRGVATQADLDIWKSGLQAQRVFSKIKHGALILVEKQVEQYETDFKTALAENKKAVENGEAPKSTQGLESKYHDAANKAKELKRPWTLVLTESEQVNAYVSGHLPRTVFITQGLFRHVTHNDDELGMILGHELSHYLLSHTREGLSLIL